MQLVTCHPDLQRVLREAIKYTDFVVVEGHRGKAAQDAAYAKGFSKVRWPNGNHNSLPSRAVDLVPYPVDWSDAPKNIERFCMLAGVVLTVAQQLGVRLRWGGDWNHNADTRDEGSFRDRPHFELL
jgi:hypothetical protein